MFEEIEVEDSSPFLVYVNNGGFRLLYSWVVQVALSGIMVEGGRRGDSNLAFTLHG